MLSYSHVLVGLGVIAAIVVGVGCNLAGGSDLADAAAGTDSGESDDFLLTVKPKHICVELFAAQTSYAGTVCMTIEPRVAMNVVYMTTSGWELTEAHLAVGDSMSDIPIDDKGNSQLGQFPFNSGDITGATSHTFVVPLCDYHLDGHAYIAAHASLRKRNADGTWQTETGWGLGHHIIDDSDWATQFTLSLECGAQEPPQLETCETAFAKGDASTCFIGADFDHDGSDDGIERWGWSSGPLVPGTGAAWPVYAASSQCDVGKGTRVGSLSVSYGREGNVQVVFDRVGDFVLAEEHLHVGTEPLPRGEAGRFTIAPGRYPIVRRLDDATHTENQVGGLEGDIYVAYHAVACGTHRRPGPPDAR
jgi:hypothetical protein